MKKIYYIFAMALAFFAYSESKAQSLFNVNLESVVGFSERRMNIELGDTIQFTVLSGGATELTTVGIVPSPSEAVDITISQGRENAYKYVPRAIGVYEFESNNTLGNDFTLTVVPNSPDLINLRLSASGIDSPDITIELGDTLHFYVVSGDPQILTTIGTVPAPSKVVDTTIALVPTGRTGLYYTPLAPGVYTFRADGVINDDIVVTVVGDDVTALNDQLELNGISFYPNPVKSEMNVMLDASYSYNMAISDLSGRNIITRSVSNANATSFNLEGLEKGTYLLQVSSANSKTPKAFKFVKE